METEELFSFLKTHRIPLAVLGMGLLFVLFGIVTWILSRPPQDTSSENISLDAPTSMIPSQVLTPTGETLLIIDIEGAVAKPGVYQMKPASRIGDAITQAGGLRDTADTAYIAQVINLSTKIVDSMKIYIPFLGDTVAPQAGSSTQMIQGSAGAMLNLNTATLTDLDTLPGVGPVTAQKIIDNRPYVSVADLETKKIVKANVFAQIKDKVTTE